MATDTAIEKRPTADVTRAEHTRSGRLYQPTVDILEQDDELLVLADLPGVKSEDIDINFEQGTLTIHGRVDLRQPDGTEYLHHGYGVGDFHREFQVSESVDVEKIRAEHKDGVLTLHLPKVDAVKPRKITVTNG